MMRVALVIALFVGSTAHADAIGGFWSWFATHSERLRTEKDVATMMAEVGAQLAKIDRGVIAEIDTGSPRTLVLTANGNQKLFPTVEAIYEARPQALQSWKIVCFRQRVPPTELRQMKFQRMQQTGKTLVEGQSYDPSAVRFVGRKKGRKLDIVVYVPAKEIDDEIRSMTFVMLDHILGEYDTETKIGKIDFKKADEAPKTSLMLLKLADFLDAELAPHRRR